jgi:serine/threonine-protein kinase HipA
VGIHVRAQSLHYVEQDNFSETGKLGVRCDFHFHRNGKFSLVHTTEFGALETITGTLPVEKFDEFDDLIDCKLFSRRAQKMVAKKLALEDRSVNYTKASYVYVERVIAGSKKPDVVEFTVHGNPVGSRIGKSSADATLVGMLRDIVKFIETESQSQFAEDRTKIEKVHPVSTSIHKRNVGNFEDTVFNEFFCLQLAKRCGLNVVNSSLQWINGIPTTVVERYDCEAAPDGTVRKIPQENFLQILGLPGEKKYEWDGGPGIAQCFSLMDKLGLSREEKLAFLDMLIFNFMIGNGDAHGGNFSLLLGNDRPTLAPFYDIISTIIYGDTAVATNKMAMRFPRSGYLFGDVSRGDFSDLSATIGFPKNLILERIDGLIPIVPRSASALAADLNSGDGTRSPTYAKIVAVVNDHCERLSESHKNAGGIRGLLRNIRRTLRL